MRTFAHIVSIVLHPAIIPTLTVFLMVRLDPLHAQMIPMEDLWNILLAVAIMTGILPVLSVFILSRSELIDSIHLDKRKDRFLPYIITLFYLLATYIILLEPGLPSLIYAALFGGIVAFCGLALMTLLWRVSVHLCAYAGLVGAVCGLFVHVKFPLQDLLVLMVLLGGLLASSRLRLGAHTLPEVALGSVWGFFCSFFFVSRNLYMDASMLPW
jgi:hypothetical protein